MRSGLTRATTPSPPIQPPPIVPVVPAEGQQDIPYHPLNNVVKGLLYQWQSTVEYVSHRAGAWMGCFHAAVLAAHFMGMPMVELLRLPQCDSDGVYHDNFGTRRGVLQRKFLLHIQGCLHYKDKATSLWRKFKDDVDLFCVTTLVALQSGTCDNLNDVHKLFHGADKRSVILDRINMVNKDGLVPYSFMPLDDVYRHYLALFTNESPTHITPALRCGSDGEGDQCNWSVCGDRRYKKLATLRKNRCATKQFKPPDKPFTPRQRGKRQTPDAPEETDKKPAAKRASRGSIDTTSQYIRNDEQDGGVEDKVAAPTLFCSLEDWELATGSNIPQSYLEVQAPLPVEGKSEGAACMQMNNFRSKRSSYPQGRKAITFYEYGSQQFACNKNLHKRLHGARTRKEYTENLAKAVKADIPVTTMPVRSEPYVTDELFVLSGDDVSSEFEDMFPGKSLVDIAARSTESVLSTATLDKNRKILKIQIGWKTQDFENTADFEDCSSQIFSKPKLHRSAKVIPDEQLRHDLAHVALYNQRMMLKFIQQDDLLWNVDRRKEFGDKFSADFYGDLGIEFEGGQINVTVLGRDDMEELSDIHTTHVVIERDIGTLYVPIAEGVLDHIDKNNCPKPGYEWLVSSSVILYHREHKAYFRWWFGCYFRKILGQYMDRNSNIPKVETDIQTYLATVDSTAIAAISWAKMLQRGVGKLSLTTNGLTLYAFGATPSRLTYLSLFASPINVLANKFGLTKRQRIALCSLAMLLNSAAGFYIILTIWIEEDVNPFEQPESLPLFFYNECAENPDVRSPCSSPYRSQRHGPFSGTFWNNLVSEDEGSRKYALFEFEKRGEQIEDICDTLQELLSSEDGLPPPAQLSRAVAYALSNKDPCKPHEGEFEFDESYKIPHCGKFTAFMYLPLLVTTRILEEEFIPAANHTEYNDGSTYATELARLGFGSKLQVDSLINHLSRFFDLETGIIENCLCKIYRKNKVFDIRFLGQYMYDFVGGKLVEVLLQ